MFVHTGDAKYGTDGKGMSGKHKCGFEFRTPYFEVDFLSGGFVPHTVADRPGTFDRAPLSFLTKPMPSVRQGVPGQPD